LKDLEVNCALQERLELLMEQAARLEAEATERKLRAAEALI
jgi:transcriptional antiterminator Rof (Rho-off)